MFRGCLLGREAIYTYPAYDFEFEYWKLQKVKAVAGVYREKFNIDAYVGVASNIQISLEEWLDHDDYWQETLIQAVGGLVEARNKASQEQTEKILKATQGASKEEPVYISPFNNPASRPTFQMS